MDLKLSQNILLGYLLRKHNTNLKAATQEAIKAYGLDKIIKATPTDDHITLELESYTATTSKYGRVTRLQRKPGHSRPAKASKAKSKPISKRISPLARQQAAYDEQLQRQRQQENRTVTVYVKKKRTPTRV